MTANNDGTPDAWAYVAQHETLLTKYATGRRFRPAHADIDDYHHDLLVAVVDAFERFNPPSAAKPCPLCGGRGCSTWLGWQARAVATTHNRRRARRVDEEPIDDAIAMPATTNTAGDAYRAARVSQVLSRASEPERAAALTVLAGLDEQGVYDVLGVSRPARDFRLRKLAQRFAKENPDERRQHERRA